MQQFFERAPDDPYRVLWFYLIEADVKPEQAMQNLAIRRSALDDKEWATQLVDFYLGKLSTAQLSKGFVADLKSEAELAERLCEAYFYLGKWAQLHNEPAKAATYFKLSMATNIYDFVEHRFSRLELKRLLQPKSE